MDFSFASESWTEFLLQLIKVVVSPSGRTCLYKKYSSIGLPVLRLRRDTEKRFVFTFLEKLSKPLCVFLLIHLSQDSVFSLPVSSGEAFISLCRSRIVHSKL